MNENDNGSDRIKSKEKIQMKPFFLNFLFISSNFSQQKKLLFDIVIFLKPNKTNKKQLILIYQKFKIFV